jgi:hypothetical protein
MTSVVGNATLPYVVPGNAKIRTPIASERRKQCGATFAQMKMPAKGSAAQWGFTAAKHITEKQRNLGTHALLGFNGRW